MRGLQRKKRITLNAQIFIFLIIIVLVPFFITGYFLLEDTVRIHGTYKKSCAVAEKIITEFNTYEKNDFSFWSNAGDCIANQNDDFHIRLLTPIGALVEDSRPTKQTEYVLMIKKLNSLLKKGDFGDDATQEFWYPADYYADSAILNGEEIENAKNGQTAFKLRRDHNNKQNAILYTAIPYFYHGSLFAIILVAKQLHIVYEEDQQVITFLWGAFGLSLPFIVLALVIFLFMYLRIWKPIKLLSNESQICIDKYGNIISTHFTAENKNNEIGDLSNSLSRLLKQLDKRQHELEIYASDVSHEFKNPLAAIRISSDILFHDNLPEENKHIQLDVIQNEVHHLENLLSEIREISKLENQNDASLYELIPIDEMLQNIVYYRMKAVHPEITFSCNLQCPAIKLFANPSHIDRVIENLLDNAVSFANTVYVTTSSDRYTLTIKIEDSGKGVSDEEKEKIFNRFYSNRNNYDTKTHSGLGLSTVKTIVEKLGGSITVEKSPALGGAMFSIILPLES